MKIDCVFLDFGPLGTEFRKPVRRKLEVEDMTVTTTIRGEKCKFLVPGTYVGGTLVYNVQYPQPFDWSTGGPFDVSAQQLRSVLDNSFLRQVSESLMSTPGPCYVALRRFLGFWKRPATVQVLREDGQILGLSSGKVQSFFGPKVADFLKRVGIPLDVEGRECLVITKSDLEKVEKGELK